MADPIDEAIDNEDARRKRFKGFMAQAPGDLSSGAPMVHPSPSPSPIATPAKPSFLEEIKQKLHDYLFHDSTPASGSDQANALRGGG